MPFLLDLDVIAGAAAAILSSVFKKNESKAYVVVIVDQEVGEIWDLIESLRI